jgi:putative FmdB family regulatory protein
MPIYEYLCEDCDHRFQHNRKVSERQSTPCPECRGTGRKVIGAVGVIFKGSGWHCTDYGKSGKSDDQKAAGADEKTAGADKKATGADEKTASADKKATSADGKVPAAASKSN